MKRYFVAGLLIWVPILVTIWVVKLLVTTLDSSVALLPYAYRPDNLLGFHVPGFGLILTLLVLLATGVVAKNFLGRRLVMVWESLLARIPLVRSVYAGVKQILQTVLTSDGQSFRKVWLVEYPRKGLWSVAFQTSMGFHQAQKHIKEDLITIFIPTTPNPTSGFLMLVPRKEVFEIDISVDEALKLVISLGVVLPKAKAEELISKSV